MENSTMVHPIVTNADSEYFVTSLYSEFANVSTMEQSTPDKKQ